MSWYLEVMKKYAVFSGRARRKEYWMFALINLVIIVVLAIINVMTTNESGSSLGPVGILLIVYYLAVLLPALGVCIRRLHDTGRTGWWILIALVPLIGSIVLIIFMVLEGQAGPNQYGPNPKETAA